MKATCKAGRWTGKEIEQVDAGEEAALSNGEHDDGIPIAAVPAEQRPSVFTKITDA